MHRKVVTVLFCDVVGSTALGESIDPEALQGLLARYFERMKAIVESHGGSVEKFIGDAVMAVFGVPAIHEDDALRACRAAVEMRAAFPELGLQGRIGVNTGEVVTGTEERLAAGDAVNVGSRLQNAADPDEVLIGESTLELVRGAVEIEPVEPLEIKGKSEPVPAYRLLSLLEAPERSHESRFVGRERELALVREAWDRVVGEERCELVTIVGDAGVGKSRLVAEALPSVDKVVRGRCLPYGEGITYWPVVEVIKQLGAFPSDPAAATSIRSLLRESAAATSAEEIAWAFRKLLEEQSPLVVVFDDVHWGEETFLDLVESVALLSSGPIMVVCMSRPELLERRHGWPISLRLEPLPTAAVDQLIGELPSGLRKRIAAAAGGNPLFITEMLLMTGETEEVDVPPTLRALLAARLDQLVGPERVVLECGAVEGELFHRGAIQALAADDSPVTPRLAALTRKELIRPDRPQLPGEDGFRFRHLLIRDAAYDALPKTVRAGLHARFADWLEQHAADLVELDEIAGYHLEQAARYGNELGQPDPLLAARAGAHLAAAGRRALWRGDRPAAAPLLERALELTRPARFDLVLELDLAQAIDTDARRAATTAAAAAARARSEGTEAEEATAQFMAAYYSFLAESAPELDEIERLGHAALEALGQNSDHDACTHVWSALSGVSLWRGRLEDQLHASENALEQSRLAGQQTTHLFGLDGALVYGSRPADEALLTLDALLPEHPHPQILVRRAWLLTMLGRFDEAGQLVREEGEHWRELSGDQVEYMLGYIASTAGDHQAAAAHFRRYCDTLEAGGQRGYLATYGGWLSRELCAVRDYEDAVRWAELSREEGAEDDIAPQMLWRQTLALVHAHRGEHAAAEALAQEAVTLGETTEFLNFRGDALCDLGEVLVAAGRIDDAVAAFEQARDRFERKRNLAMVAQVNERLTELQAAAQ